MSFTYSGNHEAGAVTQSSGAGGGGKPSRAPGGSVASLAYHFSDHPSPSLYHTLVPILQMT
jgi:hypothetical protein